MRIFAVVLKIYANFPFPVSLYYVIRIQIRQAVVVFKCKYLFTTATNTAATGSEVRE